MNDLDARVAALLRLAMSCSRDENTWDVLKEAIRAALQKPALHEPVTDAECLAAINTNAVWNKAYAGAIAPMRKTLESFLQGRAQPAAPVELPKLPEPDTTHYAQWAGDRIKYHSVDQIIEFANAKVAAAIAAQKGKS